MSIKTLCLGVGGDKNTDGIEQGAQKYTRMCMKPGYISDVAYQISAGKGSIIHYMVLVETSITHNTKPNTGGNLYNRKTGKVFLNKTR